MSRLTHRKTPPAAQRVLATSTGIFKGQTDSEEWLKDFGDKGMRDERRHVREPETTKLIVRGTHGGTSFEEETETIDLSMVGLSFYLKTPVALHSFVSIEISNSKVLTHIRKIQALVVRIDRSPSGKQLIGVQFL